METASLHIASHALNIMLNFVTTYMCACVRHMLSSRIILGTRMLRHDAYVYLGDCRLQLAIQPDLESSLCNDLSM